MQGGLEEVNPSKVDPSKVRRVTKEGGGLGGHIRAQERQERHLRGEEAWHGHAGVPVEDVHEWGAI